MADRAVTLSGAFQKVTLGITTKVLGAGKYSLSGITRKTVDVSEFGVDADIFEYASADGGTITISDVAYDPTDAAQNTLQTNVENKIKMTGDVTSGLLFWINSTSYRHVAAGGHILLTSAGKVESDRNNVSRTSFEGKVSGAFMTLT